MLKVQTGLVIVVTVFVTGSSQFNGIEKEDVTRYLNRLNGRITRAMWTMQVERNLTAGQQNEKIMNLMAQLGIKESFERFMKKENEQKKKIRDSVRKVMQDIQAVYEKYVDLKSNGNTKLDDIQKFINENGDQGRLILTAENLVAVSGRPSGQTQRIPMPMPMPIRP